MLPTSINRVKTWADGYGCRAASHSTKDDLSAFRFIGLHSEKFVFAISLDIDIANWQMDDKLPTPNWITRNPKSKHAHAVWLISGMVARDNIKQMQYLHTVSHGLARLISPKDHGNVTVRNLNATQNPYHPHWITQDFHDSRYELCVLAEYCDLAPKMGFVFSKSNFRSKGRNNALFYDCVKYAQAKNITDRQQIQVLVETHHIAIAAEFGGAELPQKEINSIAASICSSAHRGYPYKRRVAAAAAKRKRNHARTAEARAKALGMSKSSYYSKKLHTLKAAVQHAFSLGQERLRSQLDTSTEMVFPAGVLGAAFQPPILPEAAVKSESCCGTGGQPGLTSSSPVVAT